MRHAGDGLFIIFCSPLPAPMALAEPNAAPRVIMETNYNITIIASDIISGANETNGMARMGVDLAARRIATPGWRG
jgi:hypothetical protein